MRRLNISFGFCAGICFLAWVNPAFCGWFLLSVTVHEAGHLLAAKLLRVSVEAVELRLTGAVIRTDSVGYGKEAWITAAGPAASLLLSAWMLRCRAELAVVAAIHGVMNLLPIYPLDGGRLVRIAAYQILSEHMAETVLGVISAATACIVMLLACWWTICMQAGIWPIFAALLLVWKISNC